MFKLHKDRCETCYRIITNDEPACAGRDDEAHEARWETAFAPYREWKAQDKAWLSDTGRSVPRPEGGKPKVDFPDRCGLKCLDCVDKDERIRTLNDTLEYTWRREVECRARNELSDWDNPRLCEGCGRPLIGSGATDRHVCNSRCRAKAKRGSLLDERECQHCGKEFQPSRRDAKFCSVKCRVASHRAKS